MNMRIEPSSISGRAAAISSKSDAHRLLICAAFSDKKTVIKVSERSADIDATAACLSALGAGISYDDGHFTVIPAEKPSNESELDCMESGSTLRFLLPVVSAFTDSASFTGRGKLPQRPIGELLSAMKSGGVSFSSDHLPLEINGRLKSGNYEIPGNVSSQYISGLLMALPLAGGGTVKLTSKLESRAYVDMTVSTMSRFGVKVERLDNGWRVPEGQKYVSPEYIEADGDWSNAAFFLGAAAIGGEVTLTGLSPESVQGDKEIANVLRRFGAEVTQTPTTISVKHAPLKGCDIDISDIPDALPLLAVVAAFSEGETRFINGARLRIKESDRLSSVSALISSLGGDVTELPDGLIVRGKPLTGGTADGFNDHRIVMSAAICGMYCKEPVTILGSQAVNKSYPTFFEDYRTLGGIANVI